MPRYNKSWDGRRQSRVESMVAGGRSVLPPTGDPKKDRALRQYAEQRKADPTCEVPDWADRILKRCQPPRIEQAVTRLGGAQR